MPLHPSQINIIKQARLFEGVEPHVIKLIADAESTLWETREHGEDLLRQGDTTDHSWLLVYGIVGVRKREAGSNNEVHWGFRRPIEQFTGTLSLAQTNADTSHYVFSEKSDLVRIDRDTLVSAIQLSRAFVGNFARSQAHHFEANGYRAEIGRSLEPVQKVAYILVEANIAIKANLEMNYPSVATLRLTQEQLAELAGVKFETLRKNIMPRLNKYLKFPARGKIELVDAEAIRREFVQHINFPGGV